MLALLVADGGLWRGYLMFRMVGRANSSRRHRRRLVVRIRLFL